MFESSQDSSQIGTPKVKLNTLFEMDVFNGNQVFRLFTEGICLHLFKTNE